MLAVLAAPSYRRRFDPALRADYPRVPPPPDAGAFARVVAAGEALASAFEPAADAPEEDAPEEDAATVDIGHHRLAGAVHLARAIEECERAVGPLLG